MKLSIPKSSALLVLRLPPLLVLSALLSVVAGCAKPMDERAREESAFDRDSIGEEESDEGRWRRVAEADNVELTADQLQAIEKLQSIGYLSGTVHVSRSGVTAYEKDKAGSGLNFYSDGHAAEAILMDMEGRELYRWALDFRSVWPQSNRWKEAGANWWRRVHLFDNGDILAIFEGFGLIKLDKRSVLIWAVRNHAHHDLEVLPDGRIFVLTRRAGLVPWIHETEPILDNFVSILDADGNELKSISVLEAFRRSRYREFVFRGRNRSGDVLHTNTLQVLDGSLEDRIPAFRDGNLLMAMDHLGVVAVLDPELEEIVWAFQEKPTGHHDPNLLANGNVLVFENHKDTERSVVREFDPVDLKTRWRYEGTSSRPFFSRTCGTAQRLPDGNTLVTESDGGRAFEVDSEGRIVWEFYTPYRAGESREFIATLAEMIRLPDDFPTDWLPRQEAPPH